VGQACFNFAQMLDQAKVPGEKAPASDRQLQRRVAKFFGLACAQGVPKGCVNLGVMQLDGFGGRAASASDAMRTFRASCQMKEGAGCAFAADLLMQEQVPGGQAQAANFYYEGCREGHARSCKAQAMMLNQAAIAAAKDGSVKGEHAMHAKARAIMFFRRACELGDPQSCQRFFKSHDALKVLDTRSDDEKAWLNVTPELADDAGPRTPESLQKAVYGK
jgi:TPR repeat protein